MSSYAGLPPEDKFKLAERFLELPCFKTRSSIQSIIDQLPEISSNIPTATDRETLRQFVLSLLDTCALHNAFTKLVEAVRFFDGGSVPFENLVAELTRLGLQDKLPGTVRSDDIPKQIEHFAGREKELSQLRATLTNRKRAAICAVHGMGGVGKTTLAAEYAHRYRDLYGIVGWFNLADKEGKSDFALTETGVATGYSRLAAKMSLPVARESYDVVREAVTNKLRERNDWLLIFDNAEDPTALHALLPPGNGHVLITSRNADWREIGLPVELDVLSETDALAFLLDYAGRAAWTDAAEEKTAKELAHELGYLPLALTQAAGYMDTRKMSVTSYLGLFRQRKLKLFDKKPLNYHAPVTTTWDIGVEDLKTERPDALLLLNLCAFLAPEPIRFELLREARDVLSAELSALLDPENEYELQEAKAALLKYGLAKIDETSISLHRLMGLVIREKLPRAEHAQYAEYAVRVINELYPTSIQYTNWILCEELVRHAQASASYASIAKIALVAVGYLYNQTGLYLKERAFYSVALYNFERAIIIGESELGMDHSNVAAAHSNLGNLLREMGEYNTAKAHYERAIVISEYNYGREHPNVAIDYNNIGVLLCDMGEYVAAKTYFEQAIIIGEQTLGKEHPSVAIWYGSYGGLLELFGKMEEARKYFEQALAIHEKLLDSNHPYVATSCNNLANLLSKIGEYDAAKDYYERAIAIGERVYGVDHPNIATGYNNYGMLLYKMGNTKNARDYLRRALAIRRATLSEQHPKTQGTARWLEIVGEDE
jgi:tetratricopeptide (TPR) repeat protein